MAGSACSTKVSTREREARMVEHTRCPTTGLVAKGTVVAKRTAMGIVAGMAGVAVGRGAFELPAYMAGSAIHSYVFTGQLECRFGVIEGSLIPTGSGVAGGAVGAELALVGFIFRVAGIAGLRGALVLPAHMAGSTIHSYVFAGQLECRFGVIEGNLIPTGSGVAGGAVGAELALVGFIYRVAGIAVLRGTLEFPAHMAGSAIHSYVFAGQLECRFGVIEGGLIPGGRVVTA